MHGALKLTCGGSYMYDKSLHLLAFMLWGICTFDCKEGWGGGGGEGAGCWTPRRREKMKLEKR